MANASKYFLPYQMRWLEDKSRVKIWEKSRRIGATYVQSYEDVEDCIRRKKFAVWFSSADESAAKEYILYCEQWAKLYDVAAKSLGEIVIDKDKDIKALAIEFATGSRIHALTSNPKRFRSKGGKIILDEFAHHEDQAAMWKAAKPSATWGYDIRILSTHNGKQSLFFKFIEKIKKKKLNWSLHTTDIYTAVKEGLLFKIFGRKLSEKEEQDWLKQEKEDCFDDITWLEEYCCDAQDEGDAFIPYDLINLCTEAGLLWKQDIIDQTWNGSKITEPQNVKNKWVHEKIQKFSEWVLSLKVEGNLFLGYDVARRKDLTCIKVIEQIGKINFLRGYFVLDKMKFWVQREILFALLKHPRIYRACIDETGIGMQIAEEAVDEFGGYKVEAINFATGTVRSEMAFYTKSCFEDRSILIENLDEIKDDIHSMKKITTSANKIRLEADTSETKVTGHADRFWALALALHAASDGNTGPLIIKSKKRKEIISYKGY
jgi:phage FluMu gp28-like protein